MIEMREIKETCYKGTRILIGDGKRNLINRMVEYLLLCSFEEISIPIIQQRSTFDGKVGEENNNLMFNFTDKKSRELCLAPEYTAVVQRLAKTVYKDQSDVCLFYVQECFRGEKPQYGRYRQFTQLGVEILNPVKFNMEQLIFNCEILVSKATVKYNVNQNVTRGLDYYKEGKGFEITVDKLDTAKQVVGGGEYDGGMGFAIGIDRLILAMP